MKHYLFIFLAGLVPYAYGTISDKRLCADPECQVPLSEGVTAIRYQSIEPHVLSFNLGDQVTIYSKDAGSNRELWGAEIRGKRGYIPKRLVKEMRVLVRHPTFTVPTELVQQTVMPEEQVEPKQPVPTQLPEPTAQAPTQPTQLPEEIREAKLEEPAVDVPKPAVDELVKHESSDKQTDQVSEQVVEENEGDENNETDDDPNDPDDETDEADDDQEQQTLDAGKIGVKSVPIIDNVAMPGVPPIHARSLDQGIESQLPSETAQSDDSNSSQPASNEVPVVSGISEPVSLENQAANDTAVEPEVPLDVNPVLPDEKAEQEKLEIKEPVAEQDAPQTANPTEEPPVVQAVQIEPSSQEESIGDAAVEAEKDEEEPGLLNTALNWLGLSETEEPMIEDNRETVDAANLMLEIASLDPSKEKTVDETTQELETEEQPKITDAPIDGVCLKDSCNEIKQEVVAEHGFCTKENCADVSAPTVQEALVEMSTEAPVLAPPEVPAQVESTVQEDHHHHYPGDGHDHSHDDHSGHGHGHGHSHGHGHAHTHLPGYIPGFGRHYKPPEQIQQEIQMRQQQQVPVDANVQQPVPVEAVHNFQEVPAPVESTQEPPVEAPKGPAEVEQTPQPQVEEQVQAELPVESISEATALETSTEMPALEPFPESVPTYEMPIEMMAEVPIQQEPIQEQVPIEPVEQSVPVVESQPVTQAPIQQETIMESNHLPDYIPVEEIFAKMEQQRLEQPSNESGFLDLFVKQFEDSYSLPITAIAALSVVLFLTLYHAIDNGKYEKILKARIALLDAQVHELQATHEDASSTEEAEANFEAERSELQGLIKKAEEEKLIVENKLIEVEKERDSLKEEVETANEAASEANRMVEEMLASQAEHDEWQRSVEMLRDQQRITVETLNANLALKAAENENLLAELEELRSESEKYRVKIKSLQSDMETLKTTNKNFHQKASTDGAELVKLRQEKESLLSEKRSLAGQVNRQSKEIEEWREKVDQLKKTVKLKEEDLAKTVELMRSSGGDGQAVLQLASLVKTETELAEANVTIERLAGELKSVREAARKIESEKSAVEHELAQLKSSAEEAIRDKKEAETRLEVLSNYFKEKETQLQKELGTLEAKGAMSEESVSESAKRIIETEQNLALYKSQVETLKKEIEEQERSYKSRLAGQEKKAHENWVQSRQLERRLEESKQEAAQLRQRLTLVEKEKETILAAKENGTANGEVDVVKSKRLATNGEDLTMMEPALHPPPPPPPGLDIPGEFDGMYPPPPPFLPPGPFDMHLMPSIPPPPPPLADHHRPPPLGMMAGASFDVDFRREMEREPPRRYGSPTRRYPSPPRSERSVLSDRSDRLERLERYEDQYRPISPYGPHGGRPRSLGRSRDQSPDRPGSFSPLPSPLYPTHSTIHSPNEDWDESGRSYRPPMLRTSSLRAPPTGPKTSSPLVEMESHRHRPI